MYFTLYLCEINFFKDIFAVFFPFFKRNMTTKFEKFHEDIRETSPTDKFCICLCHVQKLPIRKRDIVRSIYFM